VTNDSTPYSQREPRHSAYWHNDTKEIFLLLSVAMSVIMPSVIMPSLCHHGYVIMLIVIMLTVIMLNVVMITVIKLLMSIC
jgi:hypothetical protein